MADNKATQVPCPSCGGSGQIYFFQGESRFLLSVEECPLCCGVGSSTPASTEPQPVGQPPNTGLSSQ
jgi:DnaJ-class molecular chaperone